MACDVSHRFAALILALLAPACLAAAAPPDSDAASDPIDPVDRVGGERVYHVDFAESDNPASREGGAGTLVGVTPEGWSLYNSANFPSKVTSTVMPDDGMTQRPFLRIESTKIRPHNRDLILLWQDARIPLPTDEPHTMLVRFQIRGTPGVRVRLNPQPNSTKDDFLLRGQWQNMEIRLPLNPAKNKPDAKFGLRFDVDGSGHDHVTLDLTELEVRTVSRTALREAVRAAVPKEGYPPNTMRTSRFPLGMPFGWTPTTIDYPSIFFDARADPDVLGPSGFPTLRVSPTSDDLEFIRNNERGLRFTSAPLFIPDPTQTHTFSVYVRGEGRVGVGVRRKWMAKAGKAIDLKPSDGWQRIEVAFEPEVFDSQPLAAWFTVDTAPGSAVWFDAVQLERGKQATHYQPQMQAEVQFGIDQPYGVQFADEPAVARWAVTGAPAGATLCLRVVNAYRQVSDVKRIPLDGSPLQVGELDYRLWPERELGQYRVEGWVEAGDQQVSPFDEVIVTRVRRPRYWDQDAPDSAFGAQFDAHPKIAAAAKAIGINWVRDWDSQWKRVQPERDRWADKKPRLQVYRDHNIRVLAVASAVPAWARKQFAENLEPADYPAELSYYGNFVRDFLRFHEGNVHAIEVFNEPWIARHFNRGNRKTGGGYEEFENPYARFNDLTRTAYEAVQSVDPDVQVVGINTNQANREWSEGMLSVDGLAVCDVASYHLYAFGRGIPGDNFEWVVREAIDPIREAAPGFPIWMTEGSGTPHMMGTGLIERMAPGRQEDDGIMERSDRHVRWAAGQLALNVDKLFFYTMGGGRFYEPSNWGWQVLMDGTGTLLPEAAAVSNLAWQLEDTTFAGTHPLDDHTYVFLFEYGAAETAVGIVVHDLAQTTLPEYVLPANPDLVWFDLFGNPIQPANALSPHAVFVRSPSSARELVDMLSRR